MEGQYEILYSRDYKEIESIVKSFGAQLIMIDKCGLIGNDAPDYRMIIGNVLIPESRIRAYFSDMDDVSISSC